MVCDNSVPALSDEQYMNNVLTTVNDYHQRTKHHEKTRSIFGRRYAAEPAILVEELATDEAIAEADTLLLTVPNQLGNMSPDDFEERSTGSF